MNTYLILIPIILIVIFIILEIFALKRGSKIAFNKPLSLETEIIKMPYQITKECKIPNFNNFKLVKGEPPYVNFEFKDIYFLTNSEFELLPLLENGASKAFQTTKNDSSIWQRIQKFVGVNFHVFGTVPAQLGYKLVRCTMYPNRNKIFNVYELIEIQENRLIFQKLITIDNFNYPIDYQPAEAKKALAFVEFVIEKNGIDAYSSEKELRDQFEKRN